MLKSLQQIFRQFHFIADRTLHCIFSFCEGVCQVVIAFREPSFPEQMTKKKCTGEDICLPLYSSKKKFCSSVSAALREAAVGEALRLGEGCDYRRKQEASQWIPLHSIRERDVKGCGSWVLHLLHPPWAASGSVQKTQQLLVLD